MYNLIITIWNINNGNENGKQKPQKFEDHTNDRDCGIWGNGTSPPDR